MSLLFNVLVKQTLALVDEEEGRPLERERLLQGRTKEGLLNVTNLFSFVWR